LDLSLRNYFSKAEINSSLGKLGKFIPLQITVKNNLFVSTFGIEVISQKFIKGQRKHFVVEFAKRLQKNQEVLRTMLRRRWVHL